MFCTSGKSNYLSQRDPFGKEAVGIFSQKQTRESRGQKGRIVQLENRLKDKDQLISELVEGEHIFKKKSEWINLNGRWVEPEIRDQFVDYIEKMSQRTEIDKRTIISWVGIQPGKYYDWRKRFRTSNHHNGQIPKSHCLPAGQAGILPEEYQALLIPVYR